MMPVLSARLSPSAAMVLDIEFVRRVLFYFAVGCLAFAPFVRDPLAAAAGGAVPWLIATILAKPGIPAVVLYFLMAHWIQVVAQLGVSWTDNASLSDSVWGADLARAYWYSLICIVVLSLGVRFGFSGMAAPRVDPLDEARSWRLGR